ncbi:SigB/SigF/SigG family RNA polymerase sigma factor [Salinifilum ghardaiensis]
MTDTATTTARENTTYDALLPFFDELRTLDSDSARSKLRDELITEHLPLAEHLARRFRDRGESHDDLVQVANLALVKAVDRYEPDRSSDFVSFAVPTIMGELRRHFRDTGWSVRMPRRLQERYQQVSKAISALSQQLGRAPAPSEIAEHLGVELDDVHEGMQAGHAYRSSSLEAVLQGSDSLTVSHTLGIEHREMSDVEDRAELRPLLRSLPERERRLIALRFLRGMTQSNIAQELGISQMHVSRLLTQALQRAREQAEEADNVPPQWQQAAAQAAPACGTT